MLPHEKRTISVHNLKSTSKQSVIFYSLALFQITWEGAGDASLSSFSRHLMTELLALDIAMGGKINVYDDLKDQL